MSTRRTITIRIKSRLASNPAVIQRIIERAVPENSDADLDIKIEDPSKKSSRAKQSKRPQIPDEQAETVALDEGNRVLDERARRLTQKTEPDAGSPICKQASPEKRLARRRLLAKVARMCGVRLLAGITKGASKGLEQGVQKEAKEGIKKAVDAIQDAFD